MDKCCFFCTEEVGSGHPIGDGPANACGRCVHEILVRVAVDESYRRFHRAVVARLNAAGDVAEPSRVMVAEIDGQQMLVRETWSGRTDAQT